MRRLRLGNHRALPLLNPPRSRTQERAPATRPIWTMVKLSAHLNRPGTSIKLGAIPALYGTTRPARLNWFDIAGLYLRPAANTAWYGTTAAPFAEFGNGIRKISKKRRAIKWSPHMRKTGVLPS